jgi:hypothetical protein
MRTEKLSRDRQRRFTDKFDETDLSLLPGAQHRLLKAWLTNSTQKRSWKTLLDITMKTVGRDQIELAELLAESLVARGVAVIEERFERSIWQPIALVWRNYETLCAALGLTTRTVRLANFSTAWTSAQHIEWQQTALADAYQTLCAMPSDKGQVRLSLLLKLNE